MKTWQWKKNVSLKAYCSYAIGGEAKELCFVYTKEELQGVLLEVYRKKKRYLILGKGSNCLFDDRGFNGLVIINRLKKISWEAESVLVEGGYSFSLLGLQTVKRGYGGLEFALGIPGSVGGAVFMNAGCSGFATGDVLEQVVFLHEDGFEEVYPREKISFGYRSSLFQKMKGIILSGKFRLYPQPDSQKRQETLFRYRKETQPYKERSCGCVFQNPEGESAARIIDSLGLKGLRKGGAMISSQHANFIINTGQAKAQDVLGLVDYIQKRVQEKFHISLKLEMRYIPFDE